MHFFEANHGTPAGADIGWCRYWDAIHGHVLSNKAIIKSSNKFTEYIEGILKINVLYLDENDLELSYHNEYRGYVPVQTCSQNTKSVLCEINGKLPW